MSQVSTETKVSTIALQSNVYPVTAEYPYYDKAFIDNIYDPSLLQLFNERFRGRYHLSPLQEEERKFAVPCMYAEEGDYPWGTIASESGSKVVCKCENYSCQLFSQCRPGVVAPEQYIDSDIVVEAESESAIEELEASDFDMDAFNEEFYRTLEPSSAKKQEEPVFAEAEAEGGQNVIDDEISIEDFDFSFGLEDFDLEEEFEEEEAEALSEPATEEVQGSSECKDHEKPGPTDEQLEIITLPSDKRSIVNAGPGTGKTFTLIEKIKYMLQEQGVPSEEILVLSFSRAAVSVIEERLSAAVRDGQLTVPWQSLDIRTFDKFATWILYSGADFQPEGVPAAFLPSEEEIPRLNYDQRIFAAKNLITHWDGLFDNVSHVFVDETQDLVSPRADLVLAILKSIPEYCGFTLLGDSCQAIYDYSLYEWENRKKVKKGTDSGDMLEEIQGLFAPSRFELTVNHRVKESLPYSLEPLRKALLAGDVQMARNAVRDIVNLYADNADEIRDLSNDHIQGAASEGTLGILTRTNGEALYISSLLRNKSIEHHLRQADRDDFVSRVIADVFFEYESDTIDKEQFVKRAFDADAGNMEYCEEAWYELADACRGKALGSRYLVEDILQSLSSNAKRSAFFTNVPDGTGITIGTIHSAKGREYDVVWLAIEDLEKIAESGDLDECKVAYVALSRPINNLGLKRFETSGRIMGFGDWDTGKRRHFCVPRRIATGSTRARRKRVSNVEPIDEVDVDFSSFGSKDAIQDSLRSICEPGAPLSLIKIPASEGIYPKYTICLDSDEGQRPLGLLKPSFAKGYAVAMSAIHGGSKKGIKPGHFIDQCPEAFDDLYVESVVTCIGSATEAPPHAKRFGNQFVWYGITITGLAKADSRSY